MACNTYNNLCPQPGDQPVNLLGKILSVLNNGGGGGGAGVSSISVNGGPAETGAVELTIPAGGGTVTSVNGDPGPAVSLDSGEIPEGANLYFTQARVRATPLTGFVAAPGTVTAADTVLSAFEKLQGSISPALLNFTDENANADAVVWGNAGATELIRAVGATSDLQFGPSNIMTLRGSDGRLTLAGRASFNTVSTVGHILSFTDASNSTSQVALTLTHTLSAGVGAAGMGVNLDFALDSTTTAATRAARWGTVWTVATHATRNSTSTFFNYVSGVETPQMILGNNQIAGNPGSETAPSFANRNALTNGMFFPTPSTVGWTTAGVRRAFVDGGSFYHEAYLQQQGIKGIKYGADTAGASLTLWKNRGTPTAPSDVLNGDIIGQIFFESQQSIVSTISGQIYVQATSPEINGVLPASLFLGTADTSGFLTDALEIDERLGVTVLEGRFAQNVVTLTDAATIATDASLGNIFRVTLGGNRTLGNPTNPTDGQTARWEFTQDGAGNRTIAFDTDFNFGADLPSFTLSTAAGARDYIVAVYNATDSVWDVLSGSHGF